jgi:hypothetical protein
MSSPEGFRAKNSNEGSESGLSKYSGLKESLDILTDYEEKNESAPYTYDQIVNILATDKSAREAAQTFLKSDPWDRDREAAEGMLNRLAWSLVDELSSRLGQR